MGENKALKSFLGRPLIERVLRRLAPIADDLLITANDEEPFAFPGARQVQDVRPGFGALGGLYTALRSAQFQNVAVAACDMPFVSAPLLVASAGILMQDEADVVIAETPEGLEPLHAVYRRMTCLAAIEAAMDGGRLRMISWFPEVQVRRLTRDELSRYDPDGLAFWNVNTPAEWARAEAQASGR